MRFRIDLKIFLLLLLFFATKQLELYLIIMILVIIHECGHLLMGILLKMKPEKIEIMPVGVSVSFKINTNDYNKKIAKGNILELKKIIVALAGPLTNIIILLVIDKLNVSLTKTMLIIYANILIIIFNLFPIYPLDGGRILKGILHMFFGKRRTLKYINNISLILTIILTVISSILVLYIHNVAIVIIMLYLWIMVLNEDIKFRRLEQVYKIIEKNLESTKMLV